MRPAVALLLALAGANVTRAEGLFERLLRPQEPKLRAVKAGRFLIISDYDFGGASNVAAELGKLEKRLQKELGVPAAEGVVRIYVFAGHRTFSYYVRKHIPYLRRRDTQHRNAVFLLRNDKPYIFAAYSNDLMRSLRHEFVHVVLNSAVRDVPIWLDEGLAMYYQTARPGQVQSDLTSRLESRVRRGWKPDAHRLEQLKTMPQMGPLEYAEAWAWMHLARTHAPGLISTHLAALQAGRRDASLAAAFDKRFGNAGDACRKHQRTLAGRTKIEDRR